MVPLSKSAFIVSVCAAFVLAAGQALAWGATGHRIIGRAAMAALPDDVPAFLRGDDAVSAVGELAREPDRWRNAGRTHDSDRDPGHFVNVGDDGTVLGGPVLAALPETLAAYDLALRAGGADGWKVGYLPYAIIDGWQQLAKDFAYWRADTAGAQSSPSPAHRAWMAADGAERRRLILRDLGVLAHYVGDGSQPLHVTVHFNGWGPYPNPEGFTQDHIHTPFEGEFVRAGVDPTAVQAAMPPYADCRCEIARWTAAYLAATQAQVAPLYRLQKAGGLSPGDARGRAFATARLAAGASALRDLVVDAWRSSANGRVGWPEVGVADIEAGRLDPFDSLYGVD